MAYFLRNNRGQSWYLQQALQKALEWQESLDDMAVTKNGYSYIGPHKWIVCLIGSSAYSV